MIRSVAIALILVLSGALVSSPARALQAPVAVPSTLYVLLDGLRWDLISPTVTPHLARLADRGVKGEMIPVWPTVSSPNHWALATGLYPIHSGVFHNENYDPITRKEFDWTTPGSWRGEPIWATVARQGGLSGVIGRWVGGPYMPADRGPTFYLPYDDACSNCAKLVLDLLDQSPSAKPWDHDGGAKRPRLLAVYATSLDIAEHEHGVGSPEATAQLQRLDAMIGDIVTGLAARRLDREVNIVVVADHGQLNVPPTQRVDITRFIDERLLETPPLSTGPIIQLWPKPGSQERLYDSLRVAHPHMHVWRATDIPARLHCCDLERTPPLILAADPGWSLHYKGQYLDMAGNHGYDNQVREMHPVFVAAGPGIRAGAHIAPFENVDVYSLLAHLLNVKPAKTDGSIRSLCSILSNPPPACEQAAAPAANPRSAATANVERLDPGHVLVSWTPPTPMDILLAERSDASTEKATVLSRGVQGGRYMANAPDTQRSYFLLREPDGGRVTHVAERLLPLERGSNFRDIGGYQTADGKHVRWGLIYRSGATPLLSARDVAYVRGLGLQTMIDLRTTEEQKLGPTRLAGLGIRSIAIPYAFSALFPNGPASASNSSAAGVSKAYQGWLTLFAPQFRAIFRELLSHAGPIVYNCTAGQDRSGVATALILSALGVPRETILDDYHLSTIYRHPEHEVPRIDPRAFPDNPAAPLLASVPSSRPSPLYGTDGRPLLADAFDELDTRWGSIEKYLEQELGIDASQFAALRAYYLE